MSISRIASALSLLVVAALFPALRTPVVAHATQAAPLAQAAQAGPAAQAIQVGDVPVPAPPISGDANIAAVEGFGGAWLLSSYSRTAQTTTTYLTANRGQKWVTAPPASQGWSAYPEGNELRRLVFSCPTQPCTPSSGTVEAYDGSGATRTVSTFAIPTDIGAMETVRSPRIGVFYWAFACVQAGDPLKDVHQVTLLRIADDGTVTRFSRPDGRCNTSTEIVRLPADGFGLEIRRGSLSYRFYGDKLEPVSQQTSGLAPSYNLPRPLLLDVYWIGSGNLAVSGTTREGSSVGTLTTVDYGAGPIKLNPTIKYVVRPSGKRMLVVSDRAILIDGSNGFQVAAYLSRAPAAWATVEGGLAMWNCSSPCDTAATWWLAFVPESAYQDTPDLNITNPLLSAASRARMLSQLPPLLEDPTISQAAQNHALYLNTTGILDHFETVGTAGFTGRAPSDRCAHTGTTCTGEISTTAASDASAVAAWLGAPYHGQALLNPTTLVAGASTTERFANMNFSGVTGWNFGGSAFPMTTWDGSLTWSGSESPDPTEKCPPPIGSTYGHPIYYFPPNGITPGALTVIANGKDVPVCTIEPGLYLPMSPLEPGTTYNLTVQSPGYKTPTQGWSFTTSQRPTDTPSVTPSTNPTPTANPTLSPKPNPTTDPKSTPTMGPDGLVTTVRARATYRGGRVVVIVTGRTTMNDNQVPGKLEIWRVRGSIERAFARATANSKGVYRARATMRIPRSQRGRALVWYLKKWPLIKVRGEYAGLTRVVEVRVK